MVQQVLEKTLKKNDSIFNTYCAIKELIKDEPISVDYVQSEEDTLLKNLMRKNLNSDEYVEFEKLLDEAGINAWREQVDFLGRGDGMIEHIWCEYGIDKRRFMLKIVTKYGVDPNTLFGIESREKHENKDLSVLEDKLQMLKPNDREYAMSTCLIFIEGLEARKEVV